MWTFPGLLAFWNNRYKQTVIGECFIKYENESEKAFARLQTNSCKRNCWGETQKKISSAKSPSIQMTNSKSKGWALVGIQWGLPQRIQFNTILDFKMLHSIWSIYKVQSNPIQFDLIGSDGYPSRLNNLLTPLGPNKTKRKKAPRQSGWKIGRFDIQPN